MKTLRAHAPAGRTLPLLLAVASLTVVEAFQDMGRLKLAPCPLKQPPHGGHLVTGERVGVAAAVQSGTSPIARRARRCHRGARYVQTDSHDEARVGDGFARGVGSLPDD